MIKKYWFFFGTAAVIIVAFKLPEVARFIHQSQTLSFAIFFAFFFTGLSLETASIFNQIKDIKAISAALFSSLIFFPVVSYYLGQLFFTTWPDFMVGVLIIGVAPVTVVSGTVMTAMALVPGIIYHLTQMVMDTFLAYWFRNKAHLTGGT